METYSLNYKNLKFEKVIVGADACHDVVEELSLLLGYASAFCDDVTLKVPVPFLYVYIPTVVAVPHIKLRLFA